MARVDRLGDHALLILRGQLTKLTEVEVHRAVSTALLDHGRVVVDVSGLDFGAVPALCVFGSALAQVGGWPSARLVLAGANYMFTAAVRGIGLDHAVHLGSTWGQAQALLDARPAFVRRDIELPPAGHAGIIAQAATRDACTDWALDTVSAPASTVAAELAMNAVEHTGHTSTLVLSHSALGLHIAVRDQTGISDAQPRRFGDPHRPRRGPEAVIGLADDWGVSRHEDGNTVWAVWASAGGTGH